MPDELTLPVSYSFPRKERLCSQKSIEALLRGGDVFFSYPIRATILKVEPASSNIQILVSVPKRLFKRAVMRNRLKRRIREAYRHQRHLLLPLVPEGKGILISWVFIAKGEESYSDILHAIREIMLQFSARERSAPIS